ncbi:MAG: aminotransferase class I/II-fold pyridoxal phosphate-dependent enzyme [Candidatus Omnitrophota bacterium]
MIEWNSQAETLNRKIEAASPVVFDLLSKRGKAIYFPNEGILTQGQRAKDKEINATIGIAYEDNKDPMVLPSVSSGLKIPTKDAFPYAPSQGLKSLRDKWKELMREKNPSLGTKAISTPVVTCALTHGLSMLGYLFVDEGDELIIADLNWENYDLVFINAYGGKIKNFNFFKDNKFDTEALRRAINEGPVGKKIVLLNFPNNPSGYTPTREAGEQILAILTQAAEAGNRLAVILDDAYFGLAFEDDIMKESLFARLADIHQNLLAMKVDGITKEEYAWGFRVGFITYGIKNGTAELYAALEEKTAGAVRGNISNAPHLSQSLFLNALKSENYRKEKDRNAEMIKERYRNVRKILDAHPEYREFFQELPFNSGYFMCVQLKNAKAEKVWNVLLEKYSTGVIYYSEQNLLRIAFSSTPTAQLEKLFNNIYAACKDCASM